MSLNGMVALVTGGAQGIGRAVVHSLMQSSVKVSTFRSVLLRSDCWLLVDHFVHSTQDPLFKYNVPYQR